MANIKPLKLEAGRLQQLDPLVDTASAKGLFFLGDPNYVAEKVGSLLGFRKPDFSAAYNFASNGQLNYVEFFITNSQITGNRRARADLSYTSSGLPLTETWRIYDQDGTAVLRTVTYTYAFTSTGLPSIVTEATS